MDHVAANKRVEAPPLPVVVFAKPEVYGAAKGGGISAAVVFFALILLSCISCDVLT